MSRLRRPWEGSAQIRAAYAVACYEKREELKARGWVHTGGSARAIRRFIGGKWWAHVHAFVGTSRSLQSTETEVWVPEWLDAIWRAGVLPWMSPGSKGKAIVRCLKDSTFAGAVVSAWMMAGSEAVADLLRTPSTGCRP